MKQTLEIFDWEQYAPLQIAYKLTNNRAKFDSIRIDGKPIPGSLLNPAIIADACSIVIDIDFSLNPNHTTP